ncbi:MAG: tetratricopeptide repeat protein [Panacagrimonas sp.]
MLAFGFCLSACTQRTEWDKLNDEVKALYQQGRYDDGVVVAKKLIEIAEKERGPDHPNVATSLNNLGLLYDAQGQYALAEPLSRRSLSILEKALGPDHPDVAQSLNTLAGLYHAQGQYMQAEPLYRRSLSIREKALGPDHPDVAQSLNNLAELYRAQSQYAQAEPLYRRSLSILEKALGPDHLEVAQSLNSLAELYRAQGQYAQAEPLNRRALSIREKALGPDHPDVATSLNTLAELYRDQGQYAQAQPLYRHALLIREKAFGPDHPDVATSLNNLASLYQAQGQYAQAEPLYRRSLSIWEKALGLDHPDVATSLNNLALLHHDQGEYMLAEPLYRRSLSIREKALGPDHPDVAVSLNSLAELYRAQGQYAQAEPLNRRALSIREKVLGPDHPDVAQSLNNLAGLYDSQGQYVQAEPLYRRSLSIREKGLGPDHPDVATSLNNLAALHYAQGQRAQAEPLFRRSLSIFEKVLGPDHPDVATSLNNLAAHYWGSGRLSEALSVTRRATSIYRQRIIAGGVDEAAAREASLNRGGFFQHLSLLVSNPDKEPHDAVLSESLQVVQLEQATSTGSAIAKMAVRFAGNNDALAKLARSKQDAVSGRAKAEAQLLKAASEPPERREAKAEQALRDSIVNLAKAIDDIDAKLNAGFPEYQELTRPEPLDVKQVQTLLRPAEAMLVYAFGGELGGFVWVVRRESASFLPLTVEEKALALSVAKLRGQMDFDGANHPLPVSVEVLHDLYKTLVVPVLPALDGVQHLMVVPEGPLLSLPLGMLVASPPPKIQSAADYRNVDWLIRHYAISVLPSVSSIRAFRQYAKQAPKQEPFAGFGDPLLGNDDGATRGKRKRQVDAATLFRGWGRIAAPNAAPVEIADVEAIRKQSRLPETAQEIEAMAQSLKSGPDSIWLRGDATETRVKHLDLTQYRTIAFATHGVMAGEFQGFGEPGLILTPPAQGTPEDDGYLAAGEVAQLKLNADWVLLSACNTAAADGTPGAEGFSGLAKAFFYAGSRSLLVSNWYVASEATVPLTTALLKNYEANPAGGKAEVHRRAMLALMNTPDHPEYAHPLFWAPFVVVGEGGAAR